MQPMRTHVQPTSSEGKTVLTQYGPNNALPTEPPTLQSNRCAHMYLCAANISEWKMVLSHNSARKQLTRRTSNTSNQPIGTQATLLPASSEGKIVLTQYGLNNALPAEFPTIQTNRCGQQVPVLPASYEGKIVLTQYGPNNAFPT